MQEKQSTDKANKDNEYSKSRKNSNVKGVRESLCNFFYPLLELHFLNVDIIPPLFFTKYLLLLGLETNSFNIFLDHDSIIQYSKFVIDLKINSH